ncbi:MAG: uracil phosphoribosyltransferase [Ruminococcaceae bacterium]|nr:uracil phosphoribosyltransferase [Oscillospiraceae bacterium]
MSKVVTFDHPLIQHKTTILRQTSTTNKEFRELVEEITMLMCYESLRDLPLTDVEIETPIKKTTQKMITGKDIAIVPILRAGLGMVSGMLSLVPTAKVGHIGMYRDEETMQPCEYYCKLPADIDQRLVVVVDPMLATGGSAIDAIGQIKSYGATHIKFLCLIAAPEGITALSKAHPDVEIYCANVDEGLNDKCYIVPGLGDAGDRIFGTK